MNRRCQLHGGACYLSSVRRMQAVPLDPTLEPTYVRPSLIHTAIVVLFIAGLVAGDWLARLIAGVPA